MNSEINNKKISDLLSLEELKNNLYILINKERINNKLLDYLMKEFSKKGLETSIPFDLFSDKMELENLKEEELIAFCIGSYNFLTKDKIKKDRDYVKNIKPSLYFYSAKISQNDLLQPKVKQVSEWLEYKECQRINSKEYQTFLNPKEIVYIIDNRKYRYDRAIQRASKIETLSNGMKIRKENYNKKGMMELRERYKNQPKKKDLMTTQISLTLLLTEGKEGEFEFIPKYMNTGIFKFKPIFDINREDYFPLILNDGAHRMLSLYKEYKINNKIDNGLSVMFRILTVEEAKKLTADSFKQNSTDEEYLENLDNNIENAIINTIIDNSVYLKDNVALSSSEEKINTMWGSFKEMKEFLKDLDFEIKSKAKATLMATQIGEKIKEIIEYLLEEYYNGEIERLISEKFFNRNIALLLMLLGNELRNKSSVDLIKLLDKLFTDKNSLEKILKSKEKLLNEIRKEVE